jgi:hypothetical protein
MDALTFMAAREAQFSYVTDDRRKVIRLQIDMAGYGAYPAPHTMSKGGSFFT